MSEPPLAALANFVFRPFRKKPSKPHRRNLTRLHVEQLETRDLLNAAPILSIPENQYWLVDDDVSFQLSAIDPDGDTISYTALNLPPGLMIDPKAGVISGVVQGDSATYGVTIQATDGKDGADTQFFFIAVAQLRVTSVVFVNPLPGGTATLPGTGMPTTFTIRVSGTGTPNDAEGFFYWGIREPDLLSNDELWRDRLRENVTVAANGTFSVNVDFYLFSQRDGSVSGPDDSSWESPTDPVYGTAGSRWTEHAFTPAAGRVTFNGTADVPAGTTAGLANMTSITATLTGPSGVDNPLSRTTSAFATFTVSITITGTPGATISNLRWMVIEADLNRDDHLVRERGFSATIGTNGTVTITRQFILFSNRKGEISGVDENSEEDSLGSGVAGDRDPVRILIKTSAGRILFDMTEANGLYLRSSI